jgi:hypothetical protein
MLITFLFPYRKFYLSIHRSSFSPDPNFILRSRYSPVHDERRTSYLNASSPSLTNRSYNSPTKSTKSSHEYHAQQQQSRQQNHYLSTPSLADPDAFSYGYHNLNHRSAHPTRAHSVLSVNRTDSQQANYTDAAFLDAAGNRGAARTPTTPEDQQRMLSNHLVWNKHSKSAESIDNKRLFQSSYSNMFQRQQQHRDG